MDKVHRDILRNNHRYLINTLDLSQSLVMDKLMEDDVISSGEQEYIMSQTTKREQNYRLLSLLKRKGPSKNPFDSFVNALSLNYDFVVENLEKSNIQGTRSHQENTQKEIKNHCTYCLLMRNMEPNDISHYLYENEVLTDDDLDCINNRIIPRQIRIKSLIKVLKANRNCENFLTHLVGSLKEKYTDMISDYITPDRILYCHCGEQNTEINQNKQKKCYRKPNDGVENTESVVHHPRYRKPKGGVENTESVVHHPGYRKPNDGVENTESVVHHSGYRKPKGGVENTESVVHHPGYREPKDDVENTETVFHHPGYRKPKGGVENTESVVHHPGYRKPKGGVENTETVVSHPDSRGFISHDSNMTYTLTRNTHKREIKDWRGKEIDGSKVLSNGDRFNTSFYNSCDVRFDKDHCHVCWKCKPDLEEAFSEQHENLQGIENTDISDLDIRTCKINLGDEMSCDLVPSCDCEEQKPCMKYAKKEHLICSQCKIKDNDEFENITNLELQVFKSNSNNMSQNTKRTKFRKVSDKEFTKQTENSNTMSVVQTVSKFMPSDKKLMRLCSKLWDELFFLREKGNWDKFKLLTDGAFQKYRNKPDVQVLLFRSEMCISTFYRNDQEKAEVMFDKAMDLIPKTTMPSWHLARILPLKMELYTRCKNFEEADKLLKEAHQIMATLAPCLSTGAVYFFEAIYLGTILRCSRGGTRYDAISKRVKDCFITAIQHYEQEQFFAIKSFLNQVYLFLALFTLGVDFKKISYIEFQKVSEEDVSLADHYLNLFENNCWEMSTNWSRMLFYIARSEQHKQKENYQRCLDYLSDAKHCAMMGLFDEHVNFIENNIKYINEKQEEQLRVEKLVDRSVVAILDGLSDSSDTC